MMLSKIISVLLISLFICLSSLEFLSAPVQAAEANSSSLPVYPLRHFYIESNVKAKEKYTDAETLVRHLVMDGHEAYYQYGFSHDQYLNEVNANNDVDFTSATVPLLRNSQAMAQKQLSIKMLICWPSQLG